MSLSRKFIKHLRRHVIAYLALSLALSGTAYASLQVTSADIVDGQVKSVDIGNGEVKNVDVADSSITATKVLNNTLNGDDVKDDTLTGADVKNGLLTGIDVGDASLTGADIKNDSLTGADMQESTLSVAKMGCQTGKVLGFARVKGSPAIGQVWTSASAAIDTVNNCAGGKVEVKRIGPGHYYVKFAGFTPALAVATANNDGLPPDNISVDNIVSIAKVSAAPGEIPEANTSTFRVEVHDVNPTASSGVVPQDGWFSILIP